ncbi:MAG TPA: FAD-binding oxidoreductase [Solirubrobacteraceae bacterium]|nr:FAD-binding oxidoreductase [Solirubrobacteraceae bacterium]
MRYNSAMIDRQPPHGRLLHRGGADYEAARLNAVWNGRKPDREPEQILLAATAEDVVWGVRHAAFEGLRVSVRSGGHSWYGNCLRAGALLLDLSALTEISVDPRAMVASVGPGTLGRDLDAALADRGLFFPIGHCATVGLGGFALGGGYGWNSRTRGPAGLNIRAIDVVLANGEHVHADDSTHPELLWAARGAGPGFFGVVTRFHFELCPRPRMLRTGDVYPLDVHDEVLAWALALAPSLPPEVEVSARVGYSARVGAPALTLTGMAFAPDPDTGAPADPAALLEPLGTCPVVHRALDRFSIPIQRLPDLHDRGGGDAPSLRWNVDGIWTHSGAAEIIPAAVAAGLKDVPPGEHSFVLWMLWGHHEERPNACWSMQAPLYLSPNAGWEDPAEDERHGRWVDDALRDLESHSCGVQFSDANLPVRPGQGLSPGNARWLEELRPTYDPDGLFCSYLLGPE